VAGCSQSPEQKFVGKWQGDSSPEGIAMKSAKMKADNPGVSNDQIRDAVAAMAATALDVKQDKSFEVVAAGHTWKGSWTFDSAASLAQLDLKEAPADQKLPTPATWIAHLNPSDNSLELYMCDRASYDMIQQTLKGKRAPGAIVLWKK
jgi:hypothetical protein